MNVKVVSKKILAVLAPILGAGAVGVCPLCWIGSASLLTYFGLGAFIPVWRWIVVALLVLSLIGFLLDFRSHKNIYPIVILILGGTLLYLGRYVFGGPGFGGWQLWGPGIVFMLGAVFYNKRQFLKKHSRKHDEEV